MAALAWDERAEPGSGEAKQGRVLKKAKQMTNGVVLFVAVLRALLIEEYVVLVIKEKEKPGGKAVCDA